MASTTPAQRKHIIELQNSLIKAGSIPTCTNCDHWDRLAQKCKKFDMLPPGEVIVTGCEFWLHDSIPF